MDKNIVLTEDENVVQELRQSVSVLPRALLIPCLFIVIPFFFLYPLFRWGQIGAIIFSVSVFLGILLVIRAITIWSTKVLIITSRRIIDYDQVGLLKKIVSDVPLNKIDDVFYEISGLYQTFVQTGTIHIVLGESKTQLIYSNITRPQKYQQLILQLKTDYMNNQSDTRNISPEDYLTTVKKIKNSLGEERFKKMLDKVSKG